VTGHPDAETIARYREGDLGPWRSWRVRSHLARCAECRDVATELAGVTALLAAVQQPPMPEDMVARVHGALAREAAVRATAAHEGAAWPAETATDASPDTAGPASVPQQAAGQPRAGGTGWRARQRERARQDRQRRQRGGLPWLAGAASSPGLRIAAGAAALVVLAAGGYEISVNAGGKPGQQAAPSAVPSVGYGPGLSYQREGRVARVTPMTTSTDFTAGQLSKQVSALSKYASSSPGVPGAAPLITAPPNASSPRVSSPGAPVSPAIGSAPPKKFGSIPVNVLDGCVNRIADGADVVLVDIARFDGARATVIVTKAASSVIRQIWVVGTGCSASVSDILTHAALSSG
jgi:hypothetical protein